uniref:Uncharacterized protein n=1 Tax=Myotis myotis TaxID=51298 RepID=A0A7J7QU56_MYOMY|nr:hypothetical protein mMyoMyo1_011564 [Myotis myotis]
MPRTGSRTRHLFGLPDDTPTHRADWSPLAAGRVGRAVACRVSHCTVCSTESGPTPALALQEGRLPRQPIGGSHSPSPETLLLLDSWIVLLCLGCSWHAPGTHLVGCFTQQPLLSYSQILVTCYYDPAICVFQKVWNLHSKGCLFKKKKKYIYIIDFREEERGNGVIPHPSGSLPESLRDSGGKRPGRGGCWPGAVGQCPLPVRGWTVGWERGDEVSRTPGLGRGVLARL